MLTHFDDYPLHQTPEPVAHPATGDRNFYDRYFFNGFAKDGSLFFGAALGLYPNRRVMDASFSVLAGGKQLSVHASRLAPLERSETRVGPVAVEVIEPLRTLRLRVAPNPGGISCNLLFRARTSAIEEPRATLRSGAQVVMDSTRLTQFGRWSGTLEIEGQRLEIEPRSVLGVRDRSWGIRPVGEREAGAPSAPPQLFWLWAPFHFDDVCTHLGVFEDEAGRPWHAGGVTTPAYDGGRGFPDAADPGEVRAARIVHHIDWEPGTRRARSARLELTPHTGASAVLALEPILRFQMLGLGYLNPEWGHGHWKGNEAFGAEAWDPAALAPLDPRHVHVQQLCRARWGEREGFGVLEQLVIGPHRPSGFTSLLDGAG
ncbi:MAG TPA: hypothetical protein VII72_10860 [Myxococcota bacterium]